MIDLHCHLLWGMDDGAQSVEDTLALCKTAVENGIHTAVCTPHMLDLDETDDYLYVRDRHAEELRRLLKAEKIPLDVRLGAEVYLNDKLFTADDLEALTIENTRYLLCEFSLRPFPPERVMLLINEVCERGLVPVIAHPERYPVLHRHPGLLEDLQDVGALFQVNAASFAGLLGNEVQELAVYLFKNGIADFIGTDAHRPHWRDNAFLKYAETFPPILSQKQLRWVTEEAPALLLENKDIFAPRPKSF